MDKEYEKKFNELYKLMTSGKSKKEVYDFDSALLNDVFEDITGSPEERFDKICNKLGRVLSRLEREYIDQEDKPEIIEEIEDFLDNTVLPATGPSVEDYQQREGRITTITRDDKKTEHSCTDETFNKTMDRIEKEQFLTLINKAKRLYFKAVAYLEDIVWHREELDVEVDPDWEKTKETPVVA